MDPSLEKNADFKAEKAKRNSSDEPENPPKDKRCRRSNILRGRRSSVRFDFVEGEHEISSLIPTNVPSSERLCLLLRHCVQFSLKKSLAEVCDLKTRLEIRDKFKLALEPILNNFSADGTFDAITGSNVEQKQSSEDLELEETIRKSNEYIERLTLENERWDEVLSSHVQDTQTSETLDTNVATSRTVASDCDDLMKGLAIKKQRLRLQMKVLAQASSSLCNFCSKVDERLTNEAKELYVQEDSKKVLRAVLESNSKDDR